MKSKGIWSRERKAEYFCDRVNGIVDGDSKMKAVLKSSASRFRRNLYAASLYNYLFIAQMQLDEVA